MRRNILYISDTGSMIGGGQISLFNLLENLDTQRYRPVVCVPQEGDWSRRLERAGIIVRVFTYRKVMNPLNLFRTARSIRQLCDIILKDDIDLVHTNATGGLVFLAGIASRLTGKPLVSHIRLIDTGFTQDIIQGFLSARIVIISRRVGKKAGFLFFNKKLVLIYNGVNLERFKRGQADGNFREKLGIPHNAPLLGAAGTYIKAKGFAYLINALVALKRQFPDLRVVIAGIRSLENGGYADLLKRLAAKAGVEAMISFLDYTDDMVPFFASLDGFVFTSLNESFGRVLIEAMACEKPVVAFAAGAVPEIVVDGQTGYLVQPRNHIELAERIALLLRDKETALRLGKNGRGRCERLFDIRMHARQVQELYLQVLRERAPEYSVCPVCETPDYNVINSCRVIEQDAKIAEGTLFLCRCRKCGLVFVNPQPRVIDEDPAHLYDKDYFRDYMKFHSIAENGTLQLNEPFSLRLSLIKRFKAAGLLLDIGCASGEFLKAALDAGFSVKGVDISPYACETARNKYGLDVTQGSFETIKFPERSFDVISCADVLEHTRHPNVFLDEINRILKDDGVIYIAVPDFGSFHYRFMSVVCRFTHKNYFVLPHHLYHFTRQTLEKLLNKTGFVILFTQASESQIRESGMKRLAMQVIFLLGRLFGARDRLVVIAGKSTGKQHT